jgi:hypothetical protein
MQPVRPLLPLEKDAGRFEASLQFLVRPAGGDCLTLLLRIIRKDKQKKRRSKAPLKTVDFCLSVIPAKVGIPLLSLPLKPEVENRGKGGQRGPRLRGDDGSAS